MPKALKTLKAPRRAGPHRTRAQGDAPVPLTASHEARSAAGRVRREQCRREHLSEARFDSRDPIANLRASNRDRLAALVPIRYGRMLHSPFTFLRGAASLMAHDIGALPSPGIMTQICGDAHLGNFGGFASPERTLIFGVNDFDETTPGAFEWDLKRLAASFYVAARVFGMTEACAAAIVTEMADCYVRRIDACGRMRALDLWYQKLDLETLVSSARSQKTRRRRIELGEEAMRSNSLHAYPRMTTEVHGAPRILDHEPLIYHPRHMPDFQHDVRKFWDGYVDSMPEERRALLSRFEVVDVAIKVVGVGSVGTRCAIALLLGADGDPLFLQFKQAGASVYAPFVGGSQYSNQGQRVVIGQRIMQAGSDIFLGFSHGAHVKADFYVRQLRDMKISFFFEGMKRSDFLDYADTCAWALAQAHAKGGDAAMISGYLGRGEAFARALVFFARAYADQTERDHATLKQAVKAGRIKADLNASA